MTTATTSPTPSETFIVGETYTTGEARDYVWHFRVVARSAKFITVEDVSHGLRPSETKRVGVFIGWKGTEAALPLGRYSMAPTISADLVAPARSTDAGNTMPNPSLWSDEVGVPAVDKVEQALRLVGL